MPHSNPTDPKQFWEDRYAQSLNRQRGQAGRFLQQHITGLAPGRVLELGCSTGDDSLWLAERGWQVTAVDISEQAVQTAQRLAQEAGLATQIAFQAVDLSQHVPAGEFELVCALYFQSPYDDFPRIAILQQAAGRIVPGGHLLMVTHASAPPWAKPDENMQHHVFPTADGDWQALALPESQWRKLHVGITTRVAKGPQGQEAELQDNLIWARRI